MNKRIGCSWSGGKDSCYAMMLAMQQGYQSTALINMMNENGRISRSHGLPEKILRQQASAMNLPLSAIPSSWDDYEHNFIAVLNSSKEQYGIDAMVFGDIDLQAHRDWEEMVCQKAGLQALLPLWQQDRRQLVFQMLDAGIETIIVSCNTLLGSSFLGKVLTPALVTQLEEKGVDVCGENGEFHTLVVNCPMFEKALELPAYSTILHKGYWFLQWQ